MNIKFVFLLVLLLPQTLLAKSYESSAVGVIKKLVTFANYGNGDVYVTLPVNGTICKSGCFISKNSNGYESTFSSLLAAYQAQTPITIHGLTASDKRWSGSSLPVCEIYSVEYLR
ncbi:hypothetical protein H5183_08830 [Pseudoalteromonas sp. SR44-8]|uniref:hypothetical protein n=1 Tax=Pseudoalteromonas sp. SR44-8 TaxID=2760933 RepID=UPI001603BD9E|nr:hypothetical protein [Pseudoalteromonas sp. SR44-8]MBB1301439.1 hypothetical protein [Pseudoalteromonas sp. SR44-8]